jgi:hypothetical protein
MRVARERGALARPAAVPRTVQAARVDQVKAAMLSMQRAPWKGGNAARSVPELGEDPAEVVT